METGDLGAVLAEKMEWVVQELRICTDLTRIEQLLRIAKQIQEMN